MVQAWLAAPSLVGEEAQLPHCYHTDYWSAVQLMGGVSIGHLVPVFEHFSCTCSSLPDNFRLSVRLFFQSVIKFNSYNKCNAINAMQ